MLLHPHLLSHFRRVMTIMADVTVQNAGDSSQAPKGIRLKDLSINDEYVAVANIRDFI